APSRGAHAGGGQLPGLDARVRRSVDRGDWPRPSAQSRSLYQQMVGRGLRPYPGKADCLIIELIGNTTRHELVSVARCWGSTRAVAEQGVLGADAMQRWARTSRTGVRDGRLVQTPSTCSGAATWSGPLPATRTCSASAMTAGLALSRRPTAPGRFCTILGASSASSCASCAAVSISAIRWA